MHLEGGFSKVYNQQGVERFYNEQGANYSNPHAYDIERLLRKKLAKTNPWIEPNSKILDLACGSGQVTRPLLALGYKNISGTDPYTWQPYTKQTGRHCDKYSFKEILQDCYGDRKFDCIICSYAMHLVKQSLLNSFCNKLAELGKFLIIIAPHKLPVMKEGYGWTEVESSGLDKIHFRVFKSQLYQDEQPEEQRQQENEKQQDKPPSINQ